MARIWNERHQVAVVWESRLRSAEVSSFSLYLCFSDLFSSSIIFSYHSYSQGFLSLFSSFQTLLFAHFVLRQFSLNCHSVPYIKRDWPPLMQAALLKFSESQQRSVLMEKVDFKNQRARRCRRRLNWETENRFRLSFFFHLSIKKLDQARQQPAQMEVNSNQLPKEILQWVTFRPFTFEFRCKGIIKVVRRARPDVLLCSPSVYHYSTWQHSLGLPLHWQRIVSRHVSEISSSSLVRSNQHQAHRGPTELAIHSVDLSRLEATQRTVSGAHIWNDRLDEDEEDRTTLEAARGQSSFGSFHSHLPSGILLPFGKAVLLSFSSDDIDLRF